MLPSLLQLPLVGRGGDGKELDLAWTRGAGGGGGVPTMAFVRDALRRSSYSSSSASLLSSDHGGKGKSETMQMRTASPLFCKRSLCLSGRSLADSTHLACHGGEEVGASMRWAFVARQGFGESLEFLLPMAYSKRQKQTIGAIQGQVDGRAALGNDGCVALMSHVQSTSLVPIVSEVELL
jgi:hypothetical protein